MFSRKKESESRRYKGNKSTFPRLTLLISAIHDFLHSVDCRDFPCYCATGDEDIPRREALFQGVILTSVRFDEVSKHESIAVFAILGGLGDNVRIQYVTQELRINERGGILRCGKTQGMCQQNRIYSSAGPGRVTFTHETSFHVRCTISPQFVLFRRNNERSDLRN